MLSKKSSPNKTTANNLDNPQHNLSSASSGGNSPARSDKTNSVDEEDRPKSAGEGVPRFLSSDDIAEMANERPNSAPEQNEGVGLNGI